MRDLSAKCCGFSDATARSFAECLELNPTLERLDLSNNSINDAGGELLAIAVGVNRNLRYLNLRKNNMRATSGSVFAKSMLQNRTLKCLKLENNSINISFLDEVARFILRNNQVLLANNVSELRKDCKGYLDTRQQNWKRVREQNRTAVKSIDKLMYSVGQKT